MEEACLGLLGWGTNNGRGVPGPIGGGTHTMEEACLGLLG